jgi:acyl carrier protein
MQDKDTRDADRTASFYYEQLSIYVHDSVSQEFDASTDRLIDVLDSVGLLQLIVHIEQEFQIYLDPASLSIEVFMDLKTLSLALTEYSAAV